MREWFCRPSPSLTEIPRTDQASRSIFMRRLHRPSIGTPPGRLFLSKPAQVANLPGPARSQRKLIADEEALPPCSRGPASCPRSSRAQSREGPPRLTSVRGSDRGPGLVGFPGQVPWSKEVRTLACRPWMAPPSRGSSPWKRCCASHTGRLRPRDTQPRPNPFLLVLEASTVASPRRASPPDAGSLSLLRR